MKKVGGTILLGLILTILVLYVFDAYATPIRGTGGIGVVALFCLGVAYLSTSGLKKLFGRKKP